MDGYCGCTGNPHLFHGTAKRCGADHQGDDDWPAGDHGGTGSKRIFPGRRSGRFEILSASRCGKDERSGTWQCHRGGHESVFLYAESGNRSHGYFRQLFGQRANFVGGRHPRGGAGYVCGDHSRTDHFPGLLCLRSKSGQRAQSDLYHTAQCIFIHAGRKVLGKPVLFVYVYCGFLYYQRRL